MAKPSKTAKGKKSASYAIKKNQICKLNGTRYVPVTDPQEIATAKLEIAKQLGIGQLFEQVETAIASEKKYTQQDEMAKKPNVSEGKSTRLAANNMYGCARINYELKLLYDKISSKLEGGLIEKRDMANYGVPSLVDVLACTYKINDETEEVLRALHQYIDENI